MTAGAETVGWDEIVGWRWLSSWIARRPRKSRTKAALASATAPLRVLYLFPEAYLNTPWAVIRMILRHAVANGIEPLVVLGEHTEGPLEFGGVDVPVVRMQLRGRVSVEGLSALRKLVRERNIDLIHVVDSAPSLISGALLSLLSRTPLVVHFHSIPRLWSLKKRLMLKTVAPVAGAIVGVSKFVRFGIEEHIGISAKTLTWVYNGVDVRDFSPEVDGSEMRAELGFKDDVIAVVEPARFWLMKGQKDLVRAVAIARKENPKIELALIGWDDTSYLGAASSFRAEVEELAESLGIGDAVRCFDPVRRAPEIHAAADIVCLPSVEEPFGLVAIEAQASGRAFIGAASGAVPEVVTDGVDGLLVEPNSPETLAAALLRLAANPSLRASLGARGRDRACESFDDALLAPRFAAVYQAVIAGTALP